jgi:hypothetical protein
MMKGTIGRVPRGDLMRRPTREPANLHRRQLLTLGGLAGTRLLLPDLFRARAAAAPAARGTFGRARSVIMLYLHGGHGQHETWDPKPDGPSPERGEYGAIATSVPGIHVSELLPRCARVMHHLAVIRSVSHGNANHVQASLAAMTGHAHPPEAESRGDFPPAPTDFPLVGAVQNALRKPGPLPTWVQVGPLMRRANGTVLHGQLPGFLGPGTAPWSSTWTFSRATASRRRPPGDETAVGQEGRCARLRSIQWPLFRGFASAGKAVRLSALTAPVPIARSLGNRD